MRRLGACVLLLPLLAGCLGTSPEPRFYALQPLEVESSPAGGELAVAVGPLHVPRYLQNPQIATRKGSSEIEYEQLHRWAGSLEAESLRVLGENLGLLLGTDRVVAYPLVGPFPMKYRVRLDVERFDGRRGDAVELRVRWVVVDAATGGTLAVQLSKLRAPVGSRDVDDLVSAHSELLGELSRLIAERIAMLEAPETDEAPEPDESAGPPTAG